MKKLIFGTLLSTLFVLFSCSEDSTPAQESSSNGSMSASVNGSAWNSINGAVVASIIEGSSGDDFDKMLQIVGTASNFSSFTISLPINELSTGSQTFTGEFADGMLAYVSGTSMSTSQHTSGSFTVNITNLNLTSGLVSGTFSGVLYDDNDVSMNITNGSFSNVSIFSTDFFSNGSMSLKRNGGQIFTMDGSNEDGKFVTITQSTPNNSVSVFGNNATIGNDFGIYNINFPKNVAAGTYTLTNSGTYSAGLGNSDSEPEYNITGGSLTITSHNGNNVIGTFNYTANNGVQTVTITNGAFNITHN